MVSEVARPVIQEPSPTVVELACKLNRQIRTVCQWMNNEEDSKPIGESSLWAELKEALEGSAQIAQHIGAPVCE